VDQYGTRYSYTHRTNNILDHHSTNHQPHLIEIYYHFSFSFSVSLSRRKWLLLFCGENHYLYRYTLCCFIRTSRGIGSLRSPCYAPVYLLLCNLYVCPGLERVTRCLDAWSLCIVPIFVNSYIDCLVQVQLSQCYVLCRMIFYLGFVVASRKQFGVIDIRLFPAGVAI
jgi:hypothetical protein